MNTLYYSAVTSPGDSGHLKHYNDVVGAGMLLGAVRERVKEESMERGGRGKAVMSRKINREWYPKQPGPLLVIGDEAKKDEEKMKDRLVTSEVRGAGLERGDCNST